MRGGCGERIILQMKQDMHRIGCDDPMDQNGAKKNGVLNRMHRQFRPWPHIDIAVMQRMHVFIQKRHMQQTMYPVEIESLPNGYQQEHRDEPKRVCGPCQHRRISIC